MYWEMDRQHEEEEAERKRRKEQSRKKATKSTVSAQTLRGKLKIGIYIILDRYSHRLRCTISWKFTIYSSCNRIN
jgi:hypothetical protein